MQLSGYVVEEYISGDTSPTRATVEACRGCDVLIHEVYTVKGYEAGSQDWQQYKRKYHTSSRQLAELATKAKPKLLVLYHQNYGGSSSTEEDLMRELRDSYQGMFVCGHDLDIF